LTVLIIVGVSFSERVDIFAKGFIFSYGSGLGPLQKLSYESVSDSDDIAFTGIKFLR
jgi:hypothetical protein